MEERCADPSTQDDIDQAILDYLIHAAIVGLLEDQAAKPHRHGFLHDSNAVRLLEMVDCA